MRCTSLHGLIVVALAAVASACSWNDNPHDDLGASFPLIGVHNAIECEACHGDGEFERLPTPCETCHADVRPNRHYGKKDCGTSGCHTPVGWRATGGPPNGDDDDDTPIGDDDDVIGDDDDDTPIGDDDDDTPIGDDDDDTITDTAPPTGTSGHDFFPLLGVHDQDCGNCHTNFPTTDTERLVCLDCHEADRKDAGHYAGRDCAHCHPTEAGWGSNQVQLFELPHAAATVAECISCHPDVTDRSGTFVCTDCHLQAQTDYDHVPFQGYLYESSACVGCHPEGT